MAFPQRHIAYSAEILSPDGGEQFDSTKDQRAMSLLAFSHTPVEHQIYRAMLGEVSGGERRAAAFSARRLMVLTGVGSSSTVRRGLKGLLEKQSVERVEGGDGRANAEGATYLVFSPEEIFSRRREKGLEPFPPELHSARQDLSFDRAMHSVTGHAGLTRREALVALCCAEGLTNSEIGTKLGLTVQAVKFHLRHIFVKFGVRRRTELVARILKQGGPTGKAVKRFQVGE